MTTVTGPYDTLLKVRPLIPGNKRGNIAEISHRNVDIASAKAERVTIRARRSRTSVFSAIERRPLIQRILCVRQQVGEPHVPSNSISRKAFGGGRSNIEATISRRGGARRGGGEQGLRSRVEPSTTPERSSLIDLADYSDVT